MANAYYINLDNARARRALIEHCFNRFAPASYRLHRIAAISAADVTLNFPGTLMNAEKACILSHKKALQASLEHEGHALILKRSAPLGCGPLFRARLL